MKFKYNKKIMTVERVFHIANRWTFTIKPIYKLIIDYMGDSYPWIDPFAGHNSPAHITNDINPETKTDYHLDAIDFMKLFADESIAGVLYDPPYSLRQIKDSYNGHGLETNPCSTKYKQQMKQQINRVLMTNGYAISFGWNSNGCSIYRQRANYHAQLEKIHVLLIAHGMDKNDTIMTVERKVQETLV